MRNVILFLAVISPLLLAQPAQAQRPPRGQIGSGVLTDLKTQLEVGLKARRKVDFVFIAEATKLVNQGKLSNVLVKGTFQWARRKPYHQIQFFERALRVRARQFGVVINAPSTLKPGK